MRDSQEKSRTTLLSAARLMHRVRGSVPCTLPVRRSCPVEGNGGRIRDWGTAERRRRDVEARFPRARSEEGKLKTCPHKEPFWVWRRQTLMEFRSRRKNYCNAAQVFCVEYSAGARAVTPCLSIVLPDPSPSEGWTRAQEEQFFGLPRERAELHSRITGEHPQAKPTPRFLSVLGKSSR
jgi:hypothetical protein